MHTLDKTSIKPLVHKRNETVNAMSFTLILASHTIITIRNFSLTRGLTLVLSRRFGFYLFRFRSLLPFGRAFRTFKSCMTTLK